MSRSVTTGFSFVVAAKVFVLVVGIIGSPILVRYLGAELYGSYVFLFSMFSLYMTLVSTGVTDGVRKFLSENREGRHWEEQVLWFYLLYAAAAALAGAALLWLVARMGLVGRFVDADNLGVYLQLLAVLVIAAQFRAYVRRALMGFKLEQYSETLRMLYKLGFLLGAVGLVVLGYGVRGVLASHIFTSVLVGLVGLGFLSRQVSLRKVLFSSTNGLPRREMLSFNSLSVVLIVLLTSLYHVDVVLLRVFEGETAAAYYKVALLFAEFLWFVPVALQVVLLQSTSELFAQEDYARIKAMSARITRYTTLLTVLMGLGIAVLAPRVIPLMYSPEFLAGVTPLYILLPGAFGFAVARPILSIGQSSGQLRSLVIGTATAATLNVALNVLLIPRFGMVGAAAATTTSYGSMLLFHVWSARNIGFDPLADIRLHRTVATVAVAAPVLFVFAGAIPNDILAIVVVPPVGLAVFTVTAFVMGALEPIEVTHFLGALPGPFGDVAEGVRQRFAGPVSGSDPSRSQFQRWLFAAGAVFFVLGLALSVAGTGVVPALGGQDDTDQNSTVEPTTAPATDPGNATEQQPTNESTTTSGQQPTDTTGQPATNTTGPPTANETTDQFGTTEEETTDQFGTTEEETTDQFGTTEESTETTDQFGTTEEETTDQFGTTEEETTSETSTSSTTTTNETSTNETTTTSENETTTPENETTTDDDFF